MHLRLCRTRTNGAPADQIAHILRGNHVEELCRARQANRVDIQQQLTRTAQAFVNVKAVIQMRIVNQALPAYRGAWLFKIDTHHDQQIIRQPLSLNG